mmetsp:Transcript_50022/g.144019  ORF Transcript_50022/g.144019 Transcript_50022/m.144019 type:complete len:519 (+) Transcript_50022:193-1749(+)
MPQPPPPNARCSADALKTFIDIEGHRLEDVPPPPLWAAKPMAPRLRCSSPCSPSVLQPDGASSESQSVYNIDVPVVTAISGDVSMTLYEEAPFVDEKSAKSAQRSSCGRGSCATVGGVAAQPSSSMSSVSQRPTRVSTSTTWSMGRWWRQHSSYSVASRIVEDGEGDSIGSRTITDDQRRRRGSVAEQEGNIGDFYEVLSELGRGSFGVVVKGRCLRTGELRAIKSLSCQGEEELARSKAEIEIGRRLGHPNIIRLHEAICDGKTWHLAMQLCTGGTLHDRIDQAAAAFRAAGTLSTFAGRGGGATASSAPTTATPPGEPKLSGTSAASAKRRGGLSTQLVARYAWQMLSGLAYLHRHRYAHRDIKADNYLLETEDEAAPLRLVDFGLSKKLTGRRMNSKVGTPYATAPEVFEGWYDERIDVWSVGIVCFMLCVGYPPFQGETPEETQRLVQTGSLSFDEDDWRWHPPEVRVFLEELLTRDPLARPRAQKVVSSNTWLLHSAGLERPRGHQGACCAVS